jgi:hypothetical protein
VNAKFCVGLLFLATATAEVRFNRDIRPIMANTCFRCHGPDKSSRMAGMRLDLRDEALKPLRDGAIPIVPGDPAKSAIIQRIFSVDARVMPPSSIHKELTDVQKNTIRQWVAEGAKYEGHWAYQPVVRAEPPAAENPVDAFVLARLAKDGLHQMPEADRRTLIRRVALDLTGLPPTPEETEAFVKDTTPNAYEKVVDRLMASPRYAEQQAMHWLDFVRYADTCGFHGDNALPAWPYRDYVLHAFRDNKPFDQFTREQLAGDLIPDATREQHVASAFNRLNRTSAEGGLQPKEYLAKYGADRVRTIAAVWMGSTLGCAECHDHKFDPFLSRDFYSMKAFFADIKETGLVPDRGAKAWGTQLALPTPEQQKRQDDLKVALDAAKVKLTAKMAALEPQRAAWEKHLLEDHAAGKLAWHNQHPLTAKSSNGSTLKIYNEEPVLFTTYDGNNGTQETKPGDGLVIASGLNPDNDTYTVTFRPGAGTWTAMEVQVVQDESLPGIRVARGADRVVLSEVEAEVAGRGKIPFSSGMSNLNNPSAEFPPIAAIDGDVSTGWAIATYNENTKVALALRFAEPLHTAADSTMTVRILQNSEFRRATMGRFRIALSSGEYSYPHQEPGKEIPDNVLKSLKIAEDQRKDDDRKRIAAHFQWAAADAQPEVIAVAKLEAASAILEKQIPHVVVSEATDKPQETRILARGNFMDETGEVVQPAIPVFLGKLDTGGRRATRLDLANWLVDPRNPLTARVYVNRVWREFFGSGLSKSLDDLGSQGEWPVNPELLDWLAAEFLHPEWQATGTHDWDMSHIVRTIVLSKTYRQASANNDERDPDNRLLSHQSRYRVDAEVVRDIALSVSGLMADRFGGPSVKPVEPDGYLMTMNFPKREYSASHGADLYRRGVYTFWQRSFLHPSLLTFDAPTREECTVNRSNSNTPLQALVLLNDPIYVEAARAFAGNILKRGGSLNDRVDWAFLRTLGRAPTAEEKRVVSDLYRTSLEQFRKSPSDAAELLKVGEAPVPANEKPVELAAMTMVARALLNMHETITRN